MSLRTWEPGTTHFKSDDESRVDRRRARKAQEEKAWRDCCKVVDARDNKRCRYCYKRGHPDAISLLDKIHRHHFPARALVNEHDPACVISLCAGCHEDADRHNLDIRGDANKGVEFWMHGYMVRRELAPFVVERD